MLDFIYYPVSFILWCWHWLFSLLFGDFGPTAAISWILAIIFLTFTVRGIMFKPFVKQVRSMKKMQDFAPEMKKVQNKYANDKQRQAQEMQKLQREHGVNPLGSCLPMLLQIPVFIGLNWVLRAFQINPYGTLAEKTENYFFGEMGVDSYNQAEIFGVNLGDAIHHISTLGGQVVGAGGWNWEVAVVSVPLTVVAAIATHFTARHSAERQSASQTSTQGNFMMKMTMWIFPVGLLIFGAFFPVGLLIYFLANNGWTLMQQRVIYKKIDREEDEKKAEAAAKRDSLAPKPGQKPAPGQKPNQSKRQVQSSASTDDVTDSEPGDGGQPSKGQSKNGQGKSGQPKSGQNKSGQGKGGQPKGGGGTKSNSGGNGGGSWAKGGGAQRTSSAPPAKSGQQGKGNQQAKGNGSNKNASTGKQNGSSGKKSGSKRR